MVDGDSSHSWLCWFFTSYMVFIFAYFCNFNSILYFWPSVYKTVIIVNHCKTNHCKLRVTSICYLWVLGTPYTVKPCMEITYLTFILPDCILKFHCMVDEKCVITTEKKKNYEINIILLKIKQIMQHVLKMQQTSRLPKYIKWIYRGTFLHVVFKSSNIPHRLASWSSGLHCILSQVVITISEEPAASTFMA